MVIRFVDVGREQSPGSVNNCHDFLTRIVVGRPKFTATARGAGKPGIYKALRSVHRPFVALRIGKLSWGMVQDSASERLLKPAIICFVIGAALGQHVLLDTDVHDLRNRFEHLANRDRHARRAPFAHTFLRRVPANTRPLTVTNPQQVASKT